VDNVYDLLWAPGVTYGDVRLRDEIEQSKYVFGHVKMPEGQFADFHRDMFNRNYDFSRALIDSGLVLPALDYCLKCSHLFNVLDASGSIGVTERTSYILKVRHLAVAIAQAWVASEPAEGAAHGS
jgi:glycyl-tRNA synthetase alpha chain